MKAYALTIEPPGGIRRNSLTRELQPETFAWEFVQGVGRDDPGLASLYSPMLNLLLSKRAMTPSELACYASHRQIWRRIVEAGDRYALVFEDDAHIVDRPAFRQALEDIGRGDFDLVKLSDLRPKKVVKHAVAGRTRLVSHKMLASGTVCYVISAAAAARLLRRPKIFRAVDEDMTHAWEFGIDLWSVSPNPVEEAAMALETSVIERERQGRSGNVLRSLYGTLLQARKQHLTARYQAKLSLRS